MNTTYLILNISNKYHVPDTVGIGKWILIAKYFGQMGIPSCIFCLCLHEIYFEQDLSDIEV